MAARKKPSKVSTLMAILSILLVIALLLKFDVVANVVDPNGKMKLQNIANDSFPILLGTMLVILGIATIASVWVSVAFIAVGVVMIAQRAYQIYQRNKSTSVTTG
jgi:hypothetical protein